MAKSEYLDEVFASLAEEAMKYESAKEFAGTHIRRAKKLPRRRGYGTVYNLTPKIWEPMQVGRVTITNWYGKLYLGIIVPWEGEKTTMRTLAGGIREIRKYLTDFYDQVRRNLLGRSTRPISEQILGG